MPRRPVGMRIGSVVAGNVDGAAVGPELVGNAIVEVARQLPGMRTPPPALDPQRLRGWARLQRWGA